VVDCGALPENLLESELFGHERGAFTGAERRRVGAFERAHGGTIFLDEIGELPPSQQPALLGVLQRRRFRRVGGDREVEVDVRVIAATNRDLRDEAKSGAFRADLFYRLASVRVHLPPLRERLCDLPELVAHIAEELTGSPGGVALGKGELDALAEHGFPGNVRELRAMIERLHTMGGLDFGGAPKTPRAPAAAGEGEGGGEEAAEGSLGSYRDARAQTLADFERAYLRRLIDSCGGNASEAARVARMDRPFLLKLLRRHGLR
jgi:transcriptional regulator with GAF, ATPase, and Fis domain